MPGENPKAQSRNAYTTFTLTRVEDVQVGVAFTRYQTRFFQGKYGNLDANVISYGPCQTPTLNFAVEQHQRIASFVPEPFWAVAGSCVRSSGQRIPLEWSRQRVFKQDVGRLLLARVRVSSTVAAQSIGPLEHVCWVRKGYLLGS